MVFPKVRNRYIAFEDRTRPDERAHGLYLVTVSGTDFAKMIRASCPTASKIARSRTQYGDAELSFLEAVETPALD